MLRLISLLFLLVSVSGLGLGELEIDRCGYRLLANARGRDYDSYAASLEQTSDKKLNLVTNWMPLQANLYVDVGMGTGKVAHDVATLFPACKCLGVDLSEAMVDRATAAYKHPNLEFRVANAGKPVTKNADLMSYFSVLHEVFSFSEDKLEAVDNALKVANRTLRTGGRVIVRDFIAPSEPHKKVILRLKRDALIPGKTFEDFTSAWQKRGRRAPLKRLATDDRHLEYETDQVTAMEYLFRYKDGHWDPELAERYFFWTEAQARQSFEAAGFNVVSAKAENNGAKATMIEAGEGRMLDPATRARIPLPQDKMVFVVEKTRSLE